MAPAKHLKLLPIIIPTKHITVSTLYIKLDVPNIILLISQKHILAAGLSRIIRNNTSKSSFLQSVHMSSRPR